MFSSRDVIEGKNPTSDCSDRSLTLSLAVFARRDVKKRKSSQLSSALVKKSESNVIHSLFDLGVPIRVGDDTLPSSVREGKLPLLQPLSGNGRAARRPLKKKRQLQNLKCSPQETSAYSVSLHSLLLRAAESSA